MVLGSGLVANGFKKYAKDENYLVFASGVSNSANTDNAAFTRERHLLEDAVRMYADKTFVYFSTCSIYDVSLQDSPYVKHKLAMEAIVRQHHNYHIFRISNLVGRTNNPHTLLNFFIDHIQSNLPFPVWKNATRNIIDLDDAVSICDYIIRHKLFVNKCVNVANTQNYPIMQIVSTIEDVLEIKGNYRFVDAGSNPVIDTSVIQKIITTLHISFDSGYLIRTLRKYYC
ncbi:MAG: NAD(P)-dependent oxidoreductase [Bacteroidetes bacterium]|nr:NAD(P)-dependent oxidoreductase [Bacteroidota bacterium]